MQTSRGGLYSFLPKRSGACVQPLSQLKSLAAPSSSVKLDRQNRFPQINLTRGWKLDWRGKDKRGACP